MQNKKRGILLIGITTCILILILFISIYYINEKNKNNKNIDEEEYYKNENYKKDNYSCNLDIICDKQKVKAGEKLTYDIVARNIKAPTGIIMFETQINYDKDVFECKVNGSDEWNVISGINDYFTIMRNDLIPNLEKQLITKIEFKVKENTTKGTKVINFSKIKFTIDQDENFTIDDKNIEINVVEY